MLRVHGSLAKCSSISRAPSHIDSNASMPTAMAIGRPTADHNE
jgi:hypothetical protein